MLVFHIKIGTKKAEILAWTLSSLQVNNKLWSDFFKNWKMMQELDRTALMLAALRGHVETVHVLLGKGARIEARSEVIPVAVDALCGSVFDNYEECICDGKAPLVF